MSAADIIFFNGDYITVDDGNADEMVEAIAVKDGKILDLSSAVNIIQQYKGPNTEMKDLTGKCLMPAFIEPHSHPDVAADSYSRIQIRGNTHRSMKKVYDTLKKAASETKEGEWIVAFGLDPVYVSDMFDLDKHKLDAITTKHPLVILTQMLHHVIANSLALELAGLDETSTFATGTVEKGNDGALTGNIYEIEPIMYLGSAIPQESDNVYHNQFKNYNKCGIVTIGCTGLMKYELLHKITQSDTCTVRLGVYHHGVHQKDILGQIRMYQMLENENFKMLGVKAFVDGSPYLGTMFTKDPYLETPWTKAMKFPPGPWHGVSNYTCKQLIECLRPFHEVGLQIAIHCQGDAGIDVALDVYESLLKTQPRENHRHRMEHCGLITRPQMERAKSLGVMISFFVDHIYNYGEALSNVIIGEDRASRWTPLKTATDVGVCWTVHSDSPASPNELDVMQTMTTAMTRIAKRLQGTNDDEDLVLGAEECCQVEDIIKAYTINAAYQLFQEDKIGSISVGKLADLVVLSENPIKVGKRDTKDLKGIWVEYVYKGGKEVYSKND